MSNKIYQSSSRRTTPWSDADDRNPVQDLIDSTHAESYERKHRSQRESNEAAFFNHYVPEGCRWCGSRDFVRNGHTAAGIDRYRCRACGRTFTSATGTLFQGHKIPIREWVDFLLELFRNESFTAISKNNRNSLTTTRYWIKKVCILLDGFQDGIVLSDQVWIDETYVQEIKSDTEKRPDGKKYRGISRNQICIAAGCDSHHNIYCRVLGKGGPSSKGIWEAFGDHIAEGSTLIHDLEASHNILVRRLGLDSKSYNSNAAHMMEANPLEPIDDICRKLKGFINAHSGYNRDYLSEYIDLFVFLRSEPYDPMLKVEFVLNRVMSNPKILAYRDLYCK